MDVIVIGGGLAGLINSILIRKAGFEVTLIERKKYPFHRVCGEYISNEVIPFLESEDLFPTELHPADINEFQLSSPTGKSFVMPLDLGGFGISRYVFDAWLINKAEELGVQVRTGEVVENIQFTTDNFQIASNSNTYRSKIVVGCFGKRSTLDRFMDRRFMRKPSPYMGVKYHIQTDVMPANRISLHNFDGGYCGISKIEDNKFNLCYLTKREPVKKAASIEAFEEKVLTQNPFLKKIYQDSTFLFDKPKVINEISFEPKEAVLNHVLMAGDSAGMITPLSGNGMAMAIHSAKLSSQLICEFLRGEISRSDMETTYDKEWKKTFKVRHWAGRKIQLLFGGGLSSGMAVTLGKTSKLFSRFLMRQTHGKPF